MKQRTVLLGRVGTTVLVIGLAFFLVSLVPPMGGESTYSMSPDFYPSGSWGSVYWNVWTGVNSVHVSIATNGTLNAYILDVNPQTIDDWMNNSYSGPVDFSNVTYFDQFLRSNPRTISWQGEVHNGTLNFEYVPTAIVNVELTFSNHGPDLVSLNWTCTVFRTLAPVSKVQTLSEFAVPIGVAFTLPYLGNLLKAKKKRGGPAKQ